MLPRTEASDTTHRFADQLSDTSSLGRMNINRWRFETLLALIAHPDSIKERTDNLKMTVNTTRAVLSKFLPPGNCLLDEIDKGLKDDVLDPAFKLHQDMMTSLEIYDWQHADLSACSTKRQMLDQWDLRDAESWGPVKREHQVGKVLHCLHPSLLRLRTNGNPTLVLVKPVIIVAGRKKSNDPEQQRKREATPSGTNTRAATSQSDQLDDMSESPRNFHQFANTGPQYSDVDMTSESMPRFLGEEKVKHITIEPECLQRPRYAEGSVRSDEYTDFPAGSSSRHWEEKRAIGRCEDDSQLDVRAERRARSATPRAATLPAIRRDRDTPNETMIRRRSSHNNQPPISRPSTPIQSLPPTANLSWSLRRFIPGSAG